MALRAIFPFTHAGRAIASASFACALAACGADQADRPQSDAPTIVSLNPCLDAILVEVAEPEQILALSHYSRDPSGSSMDVEQAREFGVTGGTVEEILALQPDIVLASTFMAPATRNALDQLGLRVESFGSPTSVKQSFEQVERLAAIVGAAQAGRALSEEMQVEVWPPVTPPLANGDTPDIGPSPSALLWQPGEIVPGRETLVAELVAQSGFTDHAAALGLEQADRITLEEVLADPPDVLFVAGSSAGQRHPGLDALKDTIVYPLDTRLLYCGGPTIPLLRAELADLRHSFEDRRR